MDYHVVNRRPVFSADGIMRILRRHGMRLEFTDASADSVTARVWFFEDLEAEATYTMDDAHRFHAERGRPLSEPWQRHPEQMMRNTALRMCGGTLARNRPSAFGALATDVR